jgi:hypothetical protein
MDFIIREFIPEVSALNGKFNNQILIIIREFFHIEEEHVYGHLLPEALKFCRILASHGSSLSYNLIDRYELNKRLTNHLVSAVKYEKT